MNKKPSMVETLLDALRDVADTDPARPLFAYHDAPKGALTNLTYGGLALAARRAAGAFAALAAPGERVALLLPNSLEYVVAFFGAQAAGLVPVPLMPPAPRGVNSQGRRLAAVLDDCRAALCVVGDEVDPLPGIPSIAVGRLLGGDDATPWSELAPHDIAFLQYTSGSTSSPKGVVVTHRNLIANCAQVSAAMGTTRETVFGGWLPLFHDMGLIGKIVHPILLGASSHLIRPETFLRHPRRWLETISAQRINISAAPNFAYDLCVERVHDLSGLDLSCWTLALNGSEPVSAATLEAFAGKFAAAGFRRDAFQPVYGLAEATLFVSSRGPGRPIRIRPLARGVPGEHGEDAGGGAADASVSPSVKHVVSVGRPWLDCRVVVWNATERRAAADGEVGEVMLAGENCCAGYFEQPNLSQTTFDVVLPSRPEQRFLRTGDLGFLDDGELYITGRSKDVLLVRGRNVYPEDIEDVAQSSHPLLVRHGGAAVEVPFGGRSLVVLVQEMLPKATPADEASIRTCVSAAVSQEIGIKLHDVVLLRRGKLPKTTSGKIARSKVRELLAQRELPLAPPALPDARCIERAQSMLAWWKGAAGRIDGRLMDERRCIAPHLLLEFGNRGFLGLLAPESAGGAALGVRQMLQLVRHVASVDLTLAAFLGVHNGLVLGPLRAFGSADQNRRYLPELASGRMLGCFALTEKGAGSNPRAIASRAQRQGDRWILSGHKTWIGTAAWSGLVIFFAQAYDADGRYLGMTSFLLPVDTAGVRQGPETLTMGMRAMVQNDLIVESAEVGDDQVLGAVGGGYEVAQSTMAFGRLGVAVMALGCMERAAVLLTRYATQRVISTGPLASNPTLARRMARMHISIAAIRELTERSAALIDAGTDVPLEILSATKAMASEECWHYVDATLQALGGRGYDESNHVAQMLRDCRLLRIFEGPTEALLDFVGHAVAGESDPVCAFAARHLGLDGEAVLAFHRQTRAVLAECSARGLSVRAAHATIGEAAGLLLLQAAWSLSPVAEAGLREAGANWFAQRRGELYEAWLAGTRDRIDADGDATLLRLSAGIERELAPWAPAAMKVSLEPARELAHDAVATVGDASRVPEPRSQPASLALHEERVFSWLQVWIRRRIPRSEPAADTSFADVGLDSIDAVELLSDLNDAFALEVNPGVLWEFSSLRKLSRYLAGLLAGGRDREEIIAPAADAAALVERLERELAP
jgi:alkylation response protein AidB-like acyl-CoA dehydrogenase/acyl-CoA synthetase (AMP-forming)/AMP-acid ligase II/acyl carrier protein